MKSTYEKNLVQFTQILIFFFLITLKTIADEKKDPPKVKTQQYNAWSLRCVEVNSKDQCELIQTLTVNNTKLQYTLVYSIFKNKDKEKRESFTLVVPLGVNLQKRVALRFEGKNQLNIPFAKCEVFGCVTTLNNNTKEKVALAVFDKIKKGLEDSTFLEIAVQGFTDKPVVIKTSLVGFKDAYNNLNSKIN